MSMRKVQGVSFPRSGHHLLVDCLCRYFEPETKVTVLRWQRLSRWPRRWLRLRHWLRPQPIEGFQYCECYTHCRGTPCADSRTVFQKSHDFDLELPVKRDDYYLVQYRTALPALISWFEFSLKHGCNYVEDTKESWLDFFHERAKFYQGFHKKWVEPGERERRVLLPYEDFMRRPAEALAKAISFVDPERVLDMERIAAIAADVRETREVTDFRYYDPSLDEHLASLGIDSTAPAPNASRQL